MGMIKRIRNPNQADILYLSEPQTIAEYDPAIMKSPQSYSGKTFDIMFCYKQFNLNEEPCDITLEIFSRIIRDFPELAPEIRERYPDIELTGDNLIN